MIAVASPAHAAFPGANGKIAFGYGDIYTINPDGTGQTTLAQHGSGPAWSADGRKIAYIINGVDHLATMNADGSGQTDLGVGDSIPFSDFRNAYSFLVGSPAWSPDGKQIAFAEEFCNPDGGCGDVLEIVNADGSDRHTVPGDGADPSWSPDGQWIAFSGYCDSSTDFSILAICKAHPDGTGLTPVFSRSDGDSLSPDWSPDGTEIVFTVSYAVGTYLGSIWKVRADGTGAGVVRAAGPNFDSLYWDPAWAPDRTKIAFTWSTPYSHVSVMNSDGSDATQLTLGEKSSWQPIPGPQRSDYKNAAQFCKADQAFLGDAAFAKKYGTNGNGANAHGKCVSQNH